jgi:hypothetical protein
MNEESIFAEAIQRETPAERAEFLDKVCAGNPDLRSNVDSLLEAYDEGQFLESPACGLVTLPSPGDALETNEVEA